jgi:hypothetical protein
MSGAMETMAALFAIAVLAFAMAWAIDNWIERRWHR